MDVMVYIVYPVRVLSYIIIFYIIVDSLAFVVYSTSIYYYNVYETKDT
jgi:hypothetical protein